MRIDAHQHFWKFDPVRDSWITSEMQVIRKNFLPTDLYPLLQQESMNGCIAVQASQSEAETDFLVQLSTEYEFVKGVVGWVDLKSDRLGDRLTHFAQFKSIKGFRHIVQSEPQGFLLDYHFIDGVKQLERFNFSYDLLIYPHQLEESVSFIKQLPHQRIMIDHLAKPYIKRKEMDRWKKGMDRCASFDNTWCKLSGLITEGDWLNWDQSDFWPYLEFVLEAFGADRVVFGSDWPVCLLAASYQEVIALVEDFIAPLTGEEKRKIMGENAVRFYNL
jgi:L-fuconolactonase